MRLAIISDIHEDVVRLKKSMSIIESKNVDQIACLGDIVGYNLPFYNFYDTRNASECIRIVKDNCKFVVVGNHDLFESKKIPEHKAGFDFPDNWYAMDYLDRFKQAEGKVWLHERNSLASLISKKEKEYLYQLPEYIMADIGDRKILFSHFLHPDLTGSRADFVMQKSAFDLHQTFMKENNCSFSFSGHAHFEGACVHSPKGRKIKPFETISIKQDALGVVSPCIARGRQINGFLIFDTVKMELEIISLDKLSKIKQSFNSILNRKKETEE